MSKVIMGKLQYEVDFYDLSVMDAMDAAEEAVAQASKHREGEKSGTYMRRVCETIFAEMDRVVGEGASAEAFGPAVHWNAVLDAWWNLKNAYYQSMREVSAQMKERNAVLTKELQTAAGKPSLEEFSAPEPAKRLPVRIS